MEDHESMLTGMLNEELRRVLGSREFAKAGQMRRLLEWLAGRTEDGVTEYEIGVKVLGRRADFDPQADSIVRKEVARLREKLGRYYGEEGRENTWELVLPRGGYVLEVRERRGRLAGVLAIMPVMTAAGLEGEGEQLRMLVSGEAVSQLGVRVMSRAMVTAVGGREVVEWGVEWIVEGSLVKGERGWKAVWGLNGKGGMVKTVFAVEEASLGGVASATVVELGKELRGW